MTYESVTVVLPKHKMQVLRRWAQQELRRPRDQAAYILCNILPDDDEPDVENSKSASVKVCETDDTTGAFAGINP